MKRLDIVKPEYTYLKLISNYSVRNHNTNKLAKTIASLYRPLAQNIKRKEAQVVNLLGREMLVGTHYSYQAPAKVGLYIYIERQRADFFLIVPDRYLSIIREKISDTWPSITVENTSELPLFKDTATKYQLVYRKEDALSLRVDRRDNELLTSCLNIVDVLEPEDKVGIFYNLMPGTQSGWSATHRETINKVRTGQPIDRNKIGPAYMLKMAVAGIAGVSKDIGEVVSNGGAKSGVGVFESLLIRTGQESRVSETSMVKGRNSVISTQILIFSESPDKLRQMNNARSLVQTFDVLTEDNSLTGKRYHKPFDPLQFNVGAEVNKISVEECQNFLALPGRELLERYNFIDKVQTQETEVPADLQQGIICLGNSTFKGFKQPAYLSNDFDYRMLSLVLIGPNRAGKSKFLANVARDAIDAGECVVIPDYIGSCQLSAEIASVFPVDKVLEIKCDDYATMQGLGYNEVPLSKIPFVLYKNAKEMTALLMTLVDSINSDDANFTAKMGRYLESAALTVFLSGGSINDVFSVLMNHRRRREYIGKLPEAQKEYMVEYIEYLLELDNAERGSVVGTRSHLITGAIDRLHRLKVNAYLEMMLKKSIKGNVNLVQEMQKNQLIVIKMPQRMFLTDNEKDVYVTYWLTKIWLALQIREEQVGDRVKMTKVNLIIDELYQVNNAEKFLTRKLSQLPKFNLKPIISCHYLNQIRIIREELRSANASYMLISGCDKKNFDELSSELYPYKEEDLLAVQRYHSLNLIKCEGGYGRFITKLPKPISN